MNTITFERIANGNFQVSVGNTPTKYTIVNGNLGISGNGNNEYIIVNSETGKHTRAGSLQRAKKILSHWLQ